MLKKYHLKDYSFLLFLLVIIAMGIGVTVINSVNDNYTVKQAVGVGVSVLIMLILSLIDYHFITKFTLPLYIISALLLVAVFAFGDSSNNARRWFTIAGIRFQPSELTKVIMIIVMAVFLSAKMEEDTITKPKTFFQFIAILILPVFLIYNQPDLSTTLCLLMIMAAMYYLAGLSYKFIGITLLILIPLISLFLRYAQQPWQKLLYDHQVKRIMSFLYPTEYAEENAQQVNSVMAIGSGQLSGKGLAGLAGADSVSHTNMISEQHTDFIFSAIGESFGFVGSVIIIGIIFLIVIQCIRIGRRAKDDTGRLLAIGVGCWIGFQSFINIGVTTQLLPNTGLPLPFISYGLSSLLSNAIGIGIVLNISLQKRKF